VPAALGPDVLCSTEAERDAAEEPLLSSFLYASILAHDSFERALAFVLSNRLASAVMLPTQLFEIFHEVLTSDLDVREGALADVEACRDRVSHRAGRALGWRSQQWLLPLGTSCLLFGSIFVWKEWRC
jgi:hypothetical protein